MGVGSAMTGFVTAFKLGRTIDPLFRRAMYSHASATVFNTVTSECALR
jgi:hypothetical protein